MDLKNLSYVGLVIAVIAVVTLVFCESLFANQLTGIVIQVCAAFLMLWARLTFGRRSFHASALPTEGGLITAGPYKFLRHPIYAAILYFVWAGIAGHWSTLNGFLGVCATGGLLIRMLTEERLVSEKYPEYKSYAAATKRVIPFIL